MLEKTSTIIMNNRPLVSTDWLKSKLNDDNVCIVEASWHMPAAKRSAGDEYLQAHIPGAVFYDIDTYAAKSHLPHTLPSEAEFAGFAGALGVDENKTIVVYDSLGMFSAARVWWMFKYFGVEDVFLLDGGFPAWQSASLPVESGVVEKSPVIFNAKQASTGFVNADEVLHASESGCSRILDARSLARFSGEEAEARPGLRSGHIPNSTSLPFTELMSEGCLKSDEELKQIFDAIGITAESDVITTCGSGVTAAIISAALLSIGNTSVSIYDGSWTEWGALDSMPVATGRD